MICKLLKIKPSTLFEEFFLRSWPVVLFSLMCLLFYEQGNKHRQEFYKELKVRFQDLFDDMKEAERLNEALWLQINSQSDPAFVELTLKKVLGVVPEGQIKVFFCEEKPEGLCSETSEHPNNTKLRKLSLASKL